MSWLMLGGASACMFVNMSTVFHVAFADRRQVILAEGLDGASQTPWHENEPGNYFWTTEMDARRWALTASELDGELRDVWALPCPSDAVIDRAWEADRQRGAVKSYAEALVSCEPIDPGQLRLVAVDLASPEVLAELAPNLSNGLAAQPQPSSPARLPEL